MSSTFEQLNNSLEKLKLLQMKKYLSEVTDFVSSNKLSFSDGLLKLCNYELDHKVEVASKSMIKAAAFPFIKTIDDYDFDFQPKLNKQEILELTSLKFIEELKNIVFLGSSGVGKTHLATSLGIVAAKKRYSTYFIKCHDLLQQLKRAKVENRLDSRLKYLNRYKLLIIDELGYLPIDKEDSNLFFQLIDMRYEKKSTILTTNINFSNWDSVFYDAVVANAILDRVLHHSHVISINGYIRFFVHKYLTLYNIWQFSNDLLCRDEIWMVSKNNDGVSELYSLGEFKDEDGNKIRRDEVLSKKYIAGNYGAIPALKPMKVLREGNIQ